MKCKECPAVQYNPQKRAFFCKCTGATVRISARGCFVMPLLGLRDKNQSWTDGDDERLTCPATLDRLVGNPRGRYLALSILKQIQDNGQLDFTLSLYPAKLADKLRALMFAEGLRLMGKREAAAV